MNIMQPNIKIENSIPICPFCNKETYINKSFHYECEKCINNFIASYVFDFFIRIKFNLNINKILYKIELWYDNDPIKTYIISNEIAFHFKDVLDINFSNTKSIENHIKSILLFH